MNTPRTIGEKWLVNKKGIEYEFTKIGPKQYDRRRLTPYQMPNRANGRGKSRTHSRAPKHRPPKEISRLPNKQIDMSQMKHVRIDSRTTIIVSRSIPDAQAISNYHKKFAQ